MLADKFQLTAGTGPCSRDDICVEIQVSYHGKPSSYSLSKSFGHSNANCKLAAMEKLAPAPDVVFASLDSPNLPLMIAAKFCLYTPNSIPVSYLIPIPTRYYSGQTPCLLSGLQFRPRKEEQMMRKISIGQFVNRPKLAEKRDAEYASGDLDVMGVTASMAKKSPVHLIMMVHGLNGSASDWKFAAEQLAKRLPDTVLVHCSECNAAKLTFDGVDLMGERLADEVMILIRRWPGMQKISFVAHSLGGLVARYAVGRLYEPPREGNCLSKENSSHLRRSLEELCKGRIAGLEPVNFITFATPHLGSRGHKQLPFLCGLSFLERQASQTAHLIAGRSGKHLFLIDNDDGRPPLLLRMSTDTDDLKFISGLRSFKRRVAYANVNFDYVVGWGTSSIRRQHELPKVNVLVKDDDYPHIVYIEHETSEDASLQPSSHVDSQGIDFEEEMIRGLAQLPWERVHVSFHNSKQRFVAHNTIQVKSYWVNSDGADVIFHMIDNFLL
ncbi:hypothetical protein Nepgr_018476 [Nepenthes gracilis]|uniref:DUF676 domain-containing protein n=1 Tax=Nepenthes gracilis TaxID=150966 RepID=A0AAD3XUB0_NEPGR|nr:hypothetical protein Nepgr_018476 [Nepenthes gracilis]